MSDIKKKIKFNSDVEVLDHNGDIEFSAKAGEVVELSAASCNRWIRRNLAKFIEGGAPPKKRGRPAKVKIDDAEKPAD